MCGIAGFQGEGDLDILARMTRSLAHRGPDGEGLYNNETDRVFLGHRRLAVIDIATGAQPMKNSDGSTVIVFNGEIYNHRELRRELEALGQIFTSDHSDTEVIVRGYDAWGTNVVDRLDGMFAFAIHDMKRRRIVLARDRFGEKPLFYSIGSHGLAFASELQSLRCHPVVARRGLDPVALQKLFAYTFLPGAITPYTGVRKLLPGSTFVYDCTSRAGTERRYWRFAIESRNPPPGRVEDWIEELAVRLKHAVSTRLESDVPLGIFLSGGLDSSTIAALATECAGRSRVSTFTIAFNEASFDESTYAAMVAKTLGTAHSVETCDQAYMVRAAPLVLGRVHDLLGDPSIIPTYMLAETTRRHVTVALAGDGSDELFGGYEPFKILAKARAYKKLMPKPVHTALRVLWARVPVSERYLSLDFKVGRALRGLSYPEKLWNPVWLAALSPEEICAAFDEPIALEELYSEAIEEWDRRPELDAVDRTLEFFTNIYLPDDILVKSDRAGMLNALEIRSPFLARDLVDFVSRLPHSVKVRNGNVKWILKQAIKGLLPDDIVNRRKKGFGIPVSRWLRDLGPPAWAPIAGLNESAFEGWSREHLTGSADHRGALWCRLVLDELYRADRNFSQVAEPVPGKAH